MRIAQIVLPDASAYERKSQRIDRAALAEKHEVVLVAPDAIGEADIAHVYAGRELPSAAFVRFPIPYVSSAGLPKRRWTLRRPVPPRFVISPIGEDAVPEAVEDAYFAHPWSAFGTFSARRGEKAVIGSFDRPSVRNVREQTLARIQRFRDDVEWRIFTEQPTPEDLAGVDAWVDPAVDSEDFDGFAAEALVVGLPVVAARTPINAIRLEQGRTGFLTPPRDPNETCHAILSALFKSEVANSRQSAARQTVSKFRARQRIRTLTRLYETAR
jgi:Glycosyl transferases group 1